MKFLRLLTTVGLLTVATSAQAESWYVGGGLGAAKVNGLCEGAPRRDCGDEGAALRLFGGLQFNRYFAMEASLDFGAGFLTPGARAAGYDGGTDASFLGLNAIGTIPLGSRVSLLAGISGVLSYAVTDVTEYRYRNQSTSCYYSGYDDDWYYYCNNHRYDDKRYESNTSVAGGALLGIDVQVTNRLYVRAQAQRYFNVDGELVFGGRHDVDLFTLNARFSFH